MGTRIQDKSRKTKRPMVVADYETTTGAITVTKTPAGQPKLDKRAYPASGGLAIPTLVQGEITTTVPDPGDDPGDDPTPIDIDIYPEIYTVVEGDTLWAITQAWGVTVAEAAAFNNIADPNLIFPGEVFVKPGAAAPNDSYTKAEIRAWLSVNGIAWALGDTKAQLLALIP